VATLGDLYGRPWSEREYILVLDLYLNFRNQPRQPNDKMIQGLAVIMGRTPAAICMRLENFASVDPENSQVRRGLGHISPVCRRVFEEWAVKPEHLRSCAEAFRRDAEHAWSSRTLFEPDPVAIPRAFGKYELLDHIGQGTFGSVYSCMDAETGEEAALKIIHSDRIHDKEALHRFYREIRALKYMSHPNVIRLREDNLDVEKNFPGFLMDLAEINLTEYANECFGSRPERPPVKTVEAVDIVRSISQACVALHTHMPRIIHRDINPNNILRLVSGHWVLADFGLAKFVGAAQVTTSFATRTQRGWGTAYYAAPEQYRDFKRTDERTDVYALGVLLWEVFTSAWPPPERGRDGLPGELSGIFLKATERDIDLRYRTAQEFLEAIEATEPFGRVSSGPAEKEPS
jgi:serine/threonine protein kinase